MHISVPRRVETPKKVRCSSSSVSLQWIDTNKRNLPISYTVKWTSLSTSEIKNNSGITERFTTINGLQPNTAYDFTVTAENVAGSSDECAPKRIATGKSAVISCRAGFTNCDKYDKNVITHDPAALEIQFWYQMLQNH